MVRFKFPKMDADTKDTDPENGIQRRGLGKDGKGLAQKYLPF